MSHTTTREGAHVQRCRRRSSYTLYREPDVNLSNKCSSYRQVVGLALVALSAACSTTVAGTGQSLGRKICDGSKDIRLMYRVEVDVSSEPAFSAILYELGSDFLYVDGTCHYWVMAPSSVSETVGDPLSAWRPYHAGLLSAAQEKQLHDAIGYDDVAADGPSCVPSSAPDASPTTIWDGTNIHVCAGTLKNVDIGWPLRPQLYSSGESLNGAFRIEVGQEPGPDQKMYPWPLAQGPTAYEIPYSESLAVGQGKLVSSVGDTAALRTLRDNFLSDSTGLADFFGVILVLPKGWVLALRDELPFASGDGLWNPPSKIGP
jgi:hypothetical protein